MHQILNSRVVVVLSILLLSSCADNGKEMSTAKSVDASKNLSLRNLFGDKFMIGAALNKEQILNTEADTLPLVKKQFDALTAENEMKWESIHPTRNNYKFDSADALAAIAKDHNSFFVGHTLVWHAQTPDWVFTDNNGQNRTKQDLTAIVEEHINTVAGRYQNKVNGWDVLNEAFNEDGTLRQSKWLEILGDDYIAEVFKMAAKAAPDAELYYNDYNLFKPEKRRGVVAMAKKLIARGIKIDGIGIQGHYALDYPDLAELEDSIIAFGELGLKVMITELDVSVLPFPEDAHQGADVSQNFQLQDKYDPYRNGIPDDVNAQLGDRYKQLFALFLKHSDKISRVTFWGVHDTQTWRNYWPMQGRTDYPLLINRDKQLKPWVKDLMPTQP
ncbi:endo-1,4-beta-xylanase [Psychrosphaera sp. B3R10]|nr:endo-1,4-beta-xylanase [Psychrosphaera sp. I2R16]MBU2988265.1 endo-1,4-beta-xylanase [Psychrosphaera sp. B3R10]